MKKITILLLIAFAMPYVALAQSTNDGAIRVRDAISAALKRRNISNTIDSDGDITMDYTALGQGSSDLFSNAYITVNMEQPYFVKLFVNRQYDDRFSKDHIIKISNSLNEYKNAKVLAFDQAFSIQCEMFIKDASFFMAVFNKLCTQIGYVVNDLQEMGNSSSSSNNSSYSAPASNPGIGLNDLFPIDYSGIMLGEKISTLESKGMKFEHDNDGTSNFLVNDNRYWDFDKDGYVETIFIDNIPHLWETKYGMSRAWSYDKWMSVMQAYGFKISIYSGDEPKTATYSGRNVLKAEFKATSPDQSYEFYFWFNYGNKNGEGYSTSSPYTLDNLRVKLLK